MIYMTYFSNGSVLKSHDYLGRSAGRGGFMLWMHNLKNIFYDDRFVPDGAPSDESYKGEGMIIEVLFMLRFVAITFGAGVQWSEAYAAVNARGRFMLGGVSPGGSVGAAGGWILGGGHGALAPKYGLGM